MALSFKQKIVLTFFSFCLIACGQQSGQPERVVATGEKIAEKKPAEHFKKGEIIKQVPLLNYSNESFSLYLPESYSDTVLFPVIIFFDPHGDGSLPVNLYHKLAERYNYILIGSNTSKNGLSLEQSKVIAFHLIHETQARFKVDKNKIALCGFSGGAKVALLAGAANPVISSIIYCGAAIHIAPRQPLALLGFAGTKDMNYTDVVLFDQGLNDLPIKHYLVEWDGKHAFPTANVFMDAFDFLNTGSIKNYSNKKATIAPDKLAKEQSYKQQYLQAFQTQSTEWWRKEIASLNQKKHKDVMYERLLGFISLACYSLANNALQENNLMVAEKILTIYRLADPDNEDCKRFTAELEKRKALNTR